MKYQAITLLAFFLFHIAYSQSNNKIDLRLVLDKLEGEGFVSQEGKSAISNQLGANIKFSERRTLFNMLSDDAQNEITTFNTNTSKALRGFKSLFSSDDEMVYIPIPNTFGSQWVSLNQDDLDTRKQLFLDILSLMKANKLITDTESVYVEEMLGSEIYYFLELV